MATNLTTIVPVFNPFPHVSREFVIEHRSQSQHFVRCTVTYDPWVVHQWLNCILLLHADRLRLRQMVGGVGSSESTSTLHVCIGHYCLIFQLEYCAFVPEVLRYFLRYANVTFVKGKNEVKLWNSRHRIGVSRVFDLGEEREVPEGMPPWDVFWLTEEQIKFACVEAFQPFLAGMSARVWERD